MASDMTIEEAINHAEEVAHRKCNECERQHQQLANWLKELVDLRRREAMYKRQIAKLMGERILYAVQCCDENGEWVNCNISDDIAPAKRCYKRVKNRFKNHEYRLAMRRVTDWYEIKEEGDNE